MSVNDCLTTTYLKSLSLEVARLNVEEGFVYTHRVLQTKKGYYYFKIVKVTAATYKIAIVDKNMFDFTKVFLTLLGLNDLIGHIVSEEVAYSNIERISTTFNNMRKLITEY